MAVGAPFSYRAKCSLLHRVPATVKLLCLPAFTAAAFIENPAKFPAYSVALSILLAAGAIVAGLNSAALLRGGRLVAAMGLFAALGRSLDFLPEPVFSADGFLSGLMFAWGMTLSFCAASLFYAVTTASEIRAAVIGAERALLRPAAALLKNSNSPCLRKLRRAALRPRAGLALGLMLGFLPLFFAEWETLQTASRARAGKKGVSEIKLLVPLAVSRMTDRALETAVALEARGALL
ncbi:MAG: energy-coupling factor transporter transmembrane protein EcfT [Spirochaetaceae bacterium]|jgi:energy-coupling factor transporter transmembrane protein EcfT|nr:energy-coupling factor transporter transmembrane protein EcfT [Spirochaetaceae bacterium]